MKDIEIVVFQDKAWVRLKEYQKLKDRYEALEETNEYQNDAICSLQKQIEKMKNCQNCNKFSKEFNSISSMCFGCKNKSKWELVE